MKVILAIVGMLLLNFVANFTFSLLYSIPCEVRPINSQAMLPSLKPQDQIFVEKFSPYLNQPFKRGEVVLFYPDFLSATKKNSWQKMLLALARIKGQTGENAHFRRVAGLAGDLVEIYCPEAKIVLPATAKATEVTNPTAPATGGEIIRITCKQSDNSNSERKCIARYLVPKGFLFLIGDNTDYLGMLEDVKIFGRPQFRVSDFSSIEPQGSNSFVISKGERSQ
ncbi:MAG: S26 family signal peptidase [Candidatus Melainabacteria bacterium]|nr:S26 family signal peptidase [Candidatus Melainabacteria bacterium]